MINVDEQRLREGMNQLSNKSKQLKAATDKNINSIDQSTLTSLVGIEVRDENMLDLALSCSELVTHFKDEMVKGSDQFLFLDKILGTTIKG